MNPGSAESGVILWHEGPRAPLRHLFDLADDSSTQIDSYIELGRVLVARSVSVRDRRRSDDAFGSGRNVSRVFFVSL